MIDRIYYSPFRRNISVYKSTAGEIHINSRGLRVRAGRSKKTDYRLIGQI